jgi:4-amino-4-deoxy-L-arabinose transferase-like glycosyltransferase
MMADNFLERGWNIFYPEVNWTGPGPSHQGREFQIVSFLAAVLNKIIGWQDWHGRLIAVVFGFWTLLAFYLLSAEVVGSRRAWAPAIVLAVTPGVAFIDRSFLPEPAMLAFTTTGIWLLLLHLKTKRVIFLWLASLFVCLGILAKLPGISIIGVAIWACWSDMRLTYDPGRKALKRLLAALMLTLLLCVLYYRWAIYLGNSYPPYHVAGYGYLFQDPVGFFKKAFYLPQLANHLPWLIGLPILLLAAIGGLAVFGSQENESRFGGLYRVWLISAAGLYLFAAEEFTANPWNLVSLCLPIAGLAGEGWLKLAQQGARAERLLFSSVVVVLLFWSGASAVVTLKAPVSFASWQLGNRLRELSAPGELVVTAAAEIGNPTAIYYSRRRGWVFPPGGLCPPGGPTEDDDWSLLEDDAAAVRRLRVLQTSGANWVGIARGAKDRIGQLLLARNASLLDYLRKIAVFAEETDDWLIYKLPSYGDASREVTAESSLKCRRGELWLRH